MVAKKYIAFALAAVFALVLFYTIMNGMGYKMVKGLDGFQNAGGVDDTDIKVQMCEIFRDTYNSLASTINKMEKANIKVSDTMSGHFDGIKKQMEEHKC